MPASPEQLPTAYQQEELFLVDETTRSLPEIRREPIPPHEPNAPAVVHFAWQGYRGAVRYDRARNQDGEWVARSLDEYSEITLTLDSYGGMRILYAETIADIVPPDANDISDDILQAFIRRGIACFRQSNATPDERMPAIDHADWRLLCQFARQTDFEQFLSDVVDTIHQLRRGEQKAQSAARHLAHLALALQRRYQ